ncbi:MAG: TetR/AcrR family transcriptional regulator [Aliishimia sp.]
MASSRKTPQTWIKAGLKALSKSGVDGTRAETLARALETTKGSFYWHFKDVPEFHSALLAAWEESVAKRFQVAIGKETTAHLRLRALAGFQVSALDLSVRAWALHDVRARKTVTAVDHMILSEIDTQLSALDATHPDFPGLILASLLQAPNKGSHTETLVDLLLVLK